MARNMQEPTFLILTALAESPKHGYGLIEEVSRLSKGATKLGVGTLYTALDRLSAEGLIRHTGDETVNGRVRRFYELTDSGASALADEVARLEANLAAARASLRLRPAPTTMIAWR